DAEVQPKLLKAIEEKRFRRLGDVRERVVNVWLIAATHRDLTVLAAQNKFRRDLYYRINIFRLTVPPLRERKEDIPLLARDLLARRCAEPGQRVLELDKGTVRALLEYRWPGNIRELHNVLERAAVLCDGELLRRRDLSFEGDLEATRVEALDSHLTLEQLERRHIEQVLREEQGHVERGAKRLGISRSSLYQKINKYQLQSKI
ncbi:MAG: sigma 54-interacting transcriptional regulator, partial [Gammaproteobacteria bacterium]